MEAWEVRVQRGAAVRVGRGGRYGPYGVRRWVGGRSPMTMTGTGTSNHDQDYDYEPGLNWRR